MKAFVGLILALLVMVVTAAQKEGFHQVEYAGYEDTPLISGTPFRVHQKDRPHPPCVLPDHYRANLGTPAPTDATVLFDGSTLGQFQKSAWQVKKGVLIAGQGSLVARSAFGNCQVHLEWRAPSPAQGKPSNMGNSGVFFMGLYELQIYDSFSSKIYADGSAAAIYGQTAPLVNACLRPGQWQSYDAVFTAPVFKDGKLVAEGRITVLHNGVLVHNHTKILGPTGHRVVLPYQAHAPQLPLMIQGHGSPVEFRNIWIRKL